ncbi:DUF6694 family lipoprotein [Lysobacter sp. HA35]
MKATTKLLLVALLMAGSAFAAEPLKVDASTDQTATDSWNAMVKAAPDGQRQALLEAMLKINLAGVNSAADILATPGMDSLGIVRIKDKVGGLTAEQIIELGEKVSPVSVELSSH